jgi:endoglucanase
MASILAACILGILGGCSDTGKSGANVAGAGGALHTGGSTSTGATSNGGATTGGSGGATSGGSGGAATGGAGGVTGGAGGITSAELVRDMGLGWNLGNSLDAVSSDPTDVVDETFWGNPPATEALFLSLQNDGFESIRVPVSWRGHLGPAPSYAIDATWMNRVQEVVDYAVDNGLYAIINLHHDGGGDPPGAWIRDASTDYAGTIEKFDAIWTQIAARFQGYSDHLVFEAMNEVGFDDLPQTQAFALLNRINQEFVDLIRASGGNNPTRHLLIAGYFTDFPRSAQGTVMPTDPAGRSILSLHYYTPWSFCGGQNPTWGTASEVNQLLGQFQLVQNSFVSQGIPVILGEYGVVRTAQAQSRIFWLEYVTKLSCDLGVAPFFWDNGEEVNRRTYLWRTVGLLPALVRACSGENYTPTLQ